MAIQSDSILIKRSLLFSRYAGIAVTILGIAVLVGWMFDIALLKSVFPHAISMKANTASSLMFAGTALWLLQIGQSAKKRQLGQVCAWVVFFIGLLTFCEIMFDWDFGIDTLLFQDPVGALATGTPGRMSLRTSLSAMACSIALLTIDKELQNGLRPAQLLALAAALICIPTLIGYGYEVNSIFGERTAMALNTGVGYLVLSAGILLSRPERGFLAVITSKSKGGWIARWILVMCIGVPVCAGWLWTIGENARYFDAAFGKTFYITVCAFVFMLLIWWMARNLHQSEERTQAILENVLDGIITISEKGVIETFNNSAERIFGYTTVEVVGRKIEMLLSDAYKKEQNNFLSSFKKTTVKKVIGIAREVEGRRKDGSTFPMDIAISEMWLGTQRVFIGSVHDISERKQAQEAKTKLAAIIESSDDAIISKTLEGIITSWNPSAEKLFGYKATEIIGSSIMRLIPPDRTDEELQILERLQRGERVDHIETIRVTKDEQYIHVSATVSPIKDATGKIIGASKIVRDISERLKNQSLEAANKELTISQSELRSLFESLPGLFLVLNPDLTIVTASEAYLNATMTKREEIVGRGIFEVFPDNPEDITASGVSNLRTSLDRVRQNGVADTMSIQRYDVRRPDGVFEERYWSPINSPMFGSDRQIKYIIHRVEDVTDFVRQRQDNAGSEENLRARLGQMEAEVFQSSQKVQAVNMQLKAANQELEAFSYSVSHDLRAPLRGVVSFSRIVLEDYGAKLDDEGRRLLNVVCSEAKRMGQLIDDLLAFSRLGRREMKAADFNMSTLAKNVFASLDEITRDRVKHFKVKKLPSAHGDYAMIQQVLFNLIANAAKFSSQEPEPSIEIGAKSKDGFNIYYVKDNGVGFDPRYASKLFGVFQRLHSEEEFEGTGVGLALVQRIIHRHGGKVWAEGQPNAGATFYFSLPIQ